MPSLLGASTGQLGQLKTTCRISHRGRPCLPTRPACTCLGLVSTCDWPLKTCKPSPLQTACACKTRCLKFFLADPFPFNSDLCWRRPSSRRWSCHLSVHWRKHLVCYKMQPICQLESLEPAEVADLEADGAHLSHIGAGLTSMRKLPELLTLADSLTLLCLHGNAITRIEGLHQVRGGRSACSASCQVQRQIHAARLLS